jgi:biotin synthase
MIDGSDVTTNQDSTQALESPEFLRMSLAAAMTLDLKPGLFYREAKLHCINLLLTYRAGCAARCAYCGLSKKRPGVYSRKSFIRVTWPTYSLKEITERIAARQDRVKRICISMITNSRSVGDTRAICHKLRSRFDVPVSLLISPTLLKREDLQDFKAAGADKVGVAIDLATPELFDRYRGSGVEGPHHWDTYWSCLENAVGIFGEGNAGAHLMVGMGETEKAMCETIQRVRDMGGRTHLFSFFPEAESALADHPMPPMAQYRRVQLARYFIDNGVRREEHFSYGENDQVAGFGLPDAELDQLIDSGEPFRTSGCTGYDGQVACNRPYANSRPGPQLRNYPFPPDRKDLLRIRRQMKR